jgi:ABC-2 type transport system permease protein
MKKATWISLYTLIEKEVVRIFRIWMQSLLPSVVTTSLYFLIFGAFIGQRIGEVGGVSYLEFVVPGLVMMAIITNSFSNVVSSFFGNKFQRSIEEILVSPTPSWVIVAGYSVGGIVRGLLVGGLVLGLAFIFTGVFYSNILAILAFAIFTSILFSLAGLLNAIYAKKFDHVTIVPTFVLTPLTYLGGVFYSIDALPEFWQGVSRANPVLYMVNGFRYGFFGVSDVPVLVSFAIVIGFIVVLATLDWILIRRGVGMRS